MHSELLLVSILLAIELSRLLTIAIHLLAAVRGSAAVAWWAETEAMELAPSARFNGLGVRARRSISAGELLWSEPAAIEVRLPKGKLEPGTLPIGQITAAFNKLPERVSSICQLLATFESASIVGVELSLQPGR